MCRLPPLLPDSRHNLVVHCLMDYRLMAGGVFVRVTLQELNRKNIISPLTFSRRDRYNDRTANMLC